MGDLALSIDDKFCEVPFDAFAQWPSCLAFEPVIKRKGFFTIDLGFSESWEGGLVVEAAEAIDFFSSSWRLPHELVAGDVQDFKPLFPGSAGSDLAVLGIAGSSHSLLLY